MIASLAGRDLAEAGQCGWHEAIARLRRADGTQSAAPLEQVTVAELAAAVPFRRFRWWRGQTHMPGLYWSSTMSSHIPYESRLELARLQLADIDPTVMGIYSQPFQLSVTDSHGVERKWVPDFLLAHGNSSLAVVEVKPARRVAMPVVAERLGFFREVVTGYGLLFEVFSEPDPVVLANVVFLAGFRHPDVFEKSLLDALLEAMEPGGLPLAALESRLSPRWKTMIVRPHVLHLLWSGALVTDLSRSLGGESLIGSNP